MEHNTMNCVALEHTVTEFHFDLDFHIQGTEEFREFFTILRQASPDDAVIIHINSPGGSVQTTLQVLHAMENTKATVVTIAEGEVFSCASLIFFSGDVMQVGEFADFNLHTFSAGFDGKYNETHQLLTHYQRQRAALFDKVYSPFLTEEELGELAEGREMFMLPEEVIKRIENATKEGGGQE